MYCKNRSSFFGNVSSYVRSDSQNRRPSAMDISRKKMVVIQIVYKRIYDVCTMRQRNAMRMNWDERIRLEWSYKLCEKFVSVVDFVHVHIKPCVYIPNWGKTVGKKTYKDWDALAARENRIHIRARAKKTAFSNVYNDDEANQQQQQYCHV